VEVPAEVPFSYTTIVTTKSRIDKGLLAIPVTLLDLFPKSSGNLQVLEPDGSWAMKRFVAYGGRSKESRIYGLHDFYRRGDVEDGDELVLQVYGDGRYGLVPERQFREVVTRLESDLDHAPTDTDADAALSGLAKATNAPLDDVAESEFLRLAGQEMGSRKVRSRGYAAARDTVPPSVRLVLRRLYRGQCQVSGFSFLKSDGEPYFEVHHIDPLRGHHLKNVLVVCPNVHAQFTYASVEHDFDDAGWLRQVRFNAVAHSVFQIADQLNVPHKREVHLAE